MKKGVLNNSPLCKLYRYWTLTNKTITLAVRLVDEVANRRQAYNMTQDSKSSSNRYVKTHMEDIAINGNPAFAKSALA